LQKLQLPITGHHKYVCDGCACMNDYSRRTYVWKCPHRLRGERCQILE